MGKLIGAVIGFVFAGELTFLVLAFVCLGSDSGPGADYGA